jgi:hypothetical protein
MHIWHALARGGRAEPTMTRANGTVPIRPPLANLLKRQGTLTCLGRSESWILPNRLGRPLAAVLAAELGHATSHMVVSHYDSFLDPKGWPDFAETPRVRRIYRWEARRTAPR